MNRSSVWMPVHPDMQINRAVEMLMYMYSSNMPVVIPVVIVVMNPDILPGVTQPVSVMIISPVAYV